MKHIYNDKNFNFIKTLLIQKKVEENCNNFNVDDINMSFYETCLDKVVEKFSNISGILAIYQFGSINAIGNSDIDLIFVIEPDKNISSKIFQTFEDKFSFKEKYLVYQHNPLIVSEEIVENINYVRECKNVRLLYGENYTFNDVDDILVLLYMFIDLITQYCPFTYLNKNLSSRRSFQHVNTFKYVYYLYIRILTEFKLLINYSEIKEVQNILNKNDEYRTRYKNQCDVEEVKKFLYYAKKKIIEILNRMNLKIDNLLKTKIHIDKKLLKDKYIIGHRIFNKHYSSIRHNGINIFGKYLYYRQYPYNYLFFFRYKNYLPPNLLKAVEKRDYYVDMYVNFIRNYALGKSLYYPWWKKNGWKAVIKQVIGDIFISI